VTASTKEALDAAVSKINELMEQTFVSAPTVTTPRPPGPHPGGVCIIFYSIYNTILIKLIIQNFIILNFIIETICSR
jgi:hypothetical protein